MTTPTREEALAHFGVKGMRWGVRKLSGPKPGGRFDRVVFGKESAKRIKSAKRNKKSVAVARLLHTGNAAARALLLVVGTALVVNTVRGGATFAVQAKNSAKMTQAGRDAIPAIMSKAAKVPYAKIKGGAYVITTLT
jgi:hypothetical protein